MEEGGTDLDECPRWPRGALPSGWVPAACVVCFAQPICSGCVDFCVRVFSVITGLCVCCSCRQRVSEWLSCFCACHNGNYEVNDRMSKPKRSKERTCFVPFCTTGYRSNKRRLSLFTAPADEARLAEWDRRIKRADRRLTPTAVVCEKHFDESFIERALTITVNGVVNKIPRDKPRLKPDAVPTIFPEYPQHLLPKLPTKRKTRNLCLHHVDIPAKRRRSAKSIASEAISAIKESCAEDNSSVPEECATPRGSETESVQNTEAQHPQCTNRHPFCDLNIPVTWLKVPSLPAGTVAYAYCESEPNNFSTLFIEKMVYFEKPLPERQSVVATVYRGRKKSKQILTRSDEAKVLIKEVSVRALCGGYVVA